MASTEGYSPAEAETAAAFKAGADNESPTEGQPEISKAPKVSAELRQYTKEAHAGERQNLAAELRAERLRLFTERECLRKDIASLDQRLTEERVEADTLQREIDDLGRQQDSARSSEFKQILESLIFNRLRKSQLTDRQARLQNLQEETDEFLLDKAEMNDQLDNDASITALRGRIDAFYQDHDTEFTQLRDRQHEDEQARGVESLMQAHDAFFVHGILHRATPGNNSPLTDDATFEAKLKLLLALEPTISTSDIRSGYHPDKLWAEQGVLVTNGRVDSAYAGDAGTLPKGLRARSHIPGTDSLEAIQKTLNTRSADYHEVVVSGPQIAGLYYTSEQLRPGVNVPREDLFQLAAEMNLPIYCIRNGEVFPVTIEDGQPKLGDKNLRAESLAGKSITFDESQRVRLFEEALAKEMPFDIKRIIPAGRNLFSRSHGMEQYLALHANRLGAEANVTTMQPEDLGLDPDQLADDGTPLLTGKEIKRVDEIIRPSGERIRYLTIDGKMFTQSSEGSTGKFSNKAIELTKASTLSLKIGSFRQNLPEKESPAAAVDQYLSFIEQSIETQLANKGQNENPKSLPMAMLGELSYHVFGFGEEAGKYGDVQTQDRAFEIASKVRTLEEYKKLTQDRLDESGRFKVNIADLE
jgi:hypothetical protein